MVLNLGKCHYLIINKDITNESIELGKKTLHAEAEQKLLRIIIDKDLSALIRAAPLMTDFNKKNYLTPLLKGGSIIDPYSGCLAPEL